MSQVYQHLRRSIPRNLTTASKATTWKNSLSSRSVAWRQLHHLARRGECSKSLAPRLCSIGNNLPYSLATTANNNRSNYSSLNDLLTVFMASSAAVIALLLDTTTTVSHCEAKPEEEEEDADETTSVVNWSGTHSVDVLSTNYHEPETVAQVEQIVKLCHESGTKVRPVGSALSPNGISFSKGGMMSLANLDNILNIDKEKMTITVQSGARVSQVVDSLREHGLTLPNLASIAEQQVGGFVQVGAHGTGAKITPVDDFVISMKIVTPQMGTIEVGKDSLTTPDLLFQLTKVGLGCLGICVEVTMQCIPIHNLVEHTYVLSRSEAKEQLSKLLKQHKHMRYMWIPYTDAVVVVTNDPEETFSNMEMIWSQMASQTDTQKERLKPLTDLLRDLCAENKHPFPFSEKHLAGVGFGELRDALLAISPLDVEHVKRCNKAEAEFWKRSGGYQVKPSDQLLQFDCGGQQWVKEVCFPTGKLQKNNDNDMTFMENLLTGIEEKNIAAHSPIEQRWSSSSSSLMSPAHGPTDGLHSWVGIIMYLPSEDVTQRKDITNKFQGEYCELLGAVGENFDAASHWAKMELPKNETEEKALQIFLSKRYPVDLFNVMRYVLDPKNILSNDLMNAAFGKPSK